MQHANQLSTGIGMRAPHVRELLADRAPVGFLEVHSENYFGGGLPRKMLRQMAKSYPVSLHGVGMSLGRADGLDHDHVRRLKTLVDEICPVFVSEHLSWSGYGSIHVPDLLPLPLSCEALDVICDHIAQVQDAIGRQLLIENPSNYLAFRSADYSEWEFLNLVVERTGCGVLLDINNIAVSAHNIGFDAISYLNAIGDDGRVKQFHLGGYHPNTLASGEQIFIDTHGHAVRPDVWKLYGIALQRFGDTPTLIEWDTDIPPLDVLVHEALKADQVRAHAVAHRRECDYDRVA